MSSGQLKYQKAKKLVETGITVDQACRKVNLSPGYFYSQRAAEKKTGRVEHVTMKIAVPAADRELVEMALALQEMAAKLLKKAVQ